MTGGRAMASRWVSWLTPRDLGLIVVALVAGALPAWIDTRPGFDDTGIVISLLVVLAIPIAAVSGRRPWLWALLVGGPLPLAELAAGGSTSSIAALAFAAVGAAVGYLVAAGVRRTD